VVDPFAESQNLDGLASRSRINAKPARRRGTDGRSARQTHAV